MNLKSYVYKAIFDSLDLLIAIIDEEGNIIATNKTWQERALENGLIERVDCVGYNYIKLCESAQGDDRDTAIEIANGIKRVIKGELNTYKRVYSFVAPDGRESYFIFTITKVEGTYPRIFAITHEEIALKKEKVLVKSRGRKAASKGVSHKEGIQEKLDFKEFLKKVSLIAEEVLEKYKGKEVKEALKELLHRIETFSTPQEPHPTNPFFNLTPKEAQIAILVKEGFSSKEIARILNLSKDSIDFYRKRIRRKLGLTGKGLSLKRFLENKLG